MTAPDLRPDHTQAGAAPAETGQEQQPEQLIAPGGGLLPSGEALFPTWSCERCGLFSTTPSQPVCPGGLAGGCPMVATQGLAKVLPAGRPIGGRL